MNAEGTPRIASLLFECLGIDRHLSVLTDFVVFLRRVSIDIVTETCSVLERVSYFNCPIVPGMDRSSRLVNHLTKTSSSGCCATGAGCGVSWKVVVGFGGILLGMMSALIDFKSSSRLKDAASCIRSGIYVDARDSPAC